MREVRIDIKRWGYGRVSEILAPIIILSAMVVVGALAAIVVIRRRRSRPQAYRYAKEENDGVHSNEHKSPQPPEEGDAVAPDSFSEIVDSGQAV